LSFENALTWEFSTDTTDGYSDGTWNVIPEVSDVGGSKERDWTITPVVDVKAIRFYSLSSRISASFSEFKVFGDYSVTDPAFELTDDVGVPLDGDYPVSFSVPATVGEGYVATADFYITNTDVSDHSYNVAIVGVGDARAMVAKSGAFRISYMGGLENEDSIDILDLVGATTSGVITIHANIGADALDVAGIKNFSIIVTETE
jgi:hypothetical protein